MRNLKIIEKYVGKRVDHCIKDSFPRLSKNVLYKAFRQKDIKVNGKRVKENTILNIDDFVEVYIKDEYLFGTKENIEVVYEDENIIIVNKEQGILVQSDDRHIDEETLLDKVIDYTKESYKNIKPCHRIDRNTGGLVVFSKNEKSHSILLDLFKKREIKKYYLCYVKGHPKKNRDELKAYIEKDSKNSRVYVTNFSGKNKLTIITLYNVIKNIHGKTSDDDISLLEIELITGRTHQIRAHMAYIGHPIIGDGKYGENKLNKRYGLKCQALWAYKIIFNFKEAGVLNYLKDKVFET